MSAYRYVLTRSWLPDDGSRAVWIMLNPSTADATVDDPTIRRCVGFTARLGLSGLTVVNLYALRTTDPKLLRSHADPVGPENDDYLSRTLLAASFSKAPVIAAWGQYAQPDRVGVVQALADEYEIELLAFGTTLGGQPRHPLYVPYDTLLLPWRSPVAPGQSA